MQTRYFKTANSVVKAERGEPQIIYSVDENGDVVQTPVSLDWPEGEEITQELYESTVRANAEIRAAAQLAEQEKLEAVRASAIAKLGVLGLTADEVKALVQ